MITKKCLVCNKILIPNLKQGMKYFIEVQKFCSNECRGKNRIGKPLSIKTRLKMKANGGKNKGKHWKVKDSSKMCQRFGEQHPLWIKDDKKVPYRTIHNWVERRLGKPHFCEECGARNLKHRQYHWHNLSGEYFRDLDDWIRLCVKCHKQYDKNH